MPRARVVVATVGSPSGTAATARDMDVLSIWIKPYPLSIPMIKTTPQTAPLINTSCVPMRFNCLSMGVSGVLASPTRV